MNKIKKNIKGQGLPLNTIIIAILVILVLVILIVYFTTNMKKTDQSLTENTNSVNACKVGSYIIPSDKYVNAEYKDYCESDEIQIILAKKKEGKVCCAKERTDKSQEKKNNEKSKTIKKKTDKNQKKKVKKTLIRKRKAKTKWI